ncbi:speckle-type POZ protein-like [Planococcus citri]|uniref:speckle-type POZ protein-like n=1 Tax=Planococcus citri TaxID=170843 RepID=UPI0031F90B14
MPTYLNPSFSTLKVNMNPFFIIWMVLFASYCSSQDELSKTIVNTDSEHTIRCDTYLYKPTHEIAYTWSIHNFSQYEAKTTSQIFSPKLQSPTDDEFVWDIKIIPNGIDGENQTFSLYVFLCDTRELIADINVSIINHKNETLHSVKTTRRKIGGSYGPMAWTNFCKKDDSFRNQMLQNDTLTLSINIRRHPESPYVTVHNISRQNKTRNSSSPIPETTIIRCNLLENLEWILENPKFVDTVFSTNDSHYQCDGTPILQVHEIKYIWAIHNFSIHERLGYREILSPNLQAPTTDKYTWYVTLTPNDRQALYGRDGHIGLGVYLSKKSNATETLAQYDVSIINHEKQVLRNEKSQGLKLLAGHGKYWQYFCSKTPPSFANERLNNDTLTLYIHIKWISEPCNVQNVSHQCDISSPAATPELSLTQSCNLPQILESMLENPKFADVVFTTNGSSYPAHQSVLAARSPVFAAMFQEKYTKHGNKTARIRINFAPMGEEVLRAMLRYIYTGKCESLSELADQLFITAVKYGLDGLRNICEQTLCKTVSAANAVAMLEFAKQQQAEELKSKAMEFIENASDHKSNTTIH